MMWFFIGLIAGYYVLPSIKRLALKAHKAFFGEEA